MEARSSSDATKDKRKRRRKEETPLSTYNSAEEDEVVEVINSVSDACRSDLYVAQTRVQRNGHRYEFQGLFCHNQIHKGEFIGLYTGEFGRVQTNDTYTLQLSNGAIVSPPITEDGKVAEPGKHPIPLANEPYPASRANAFLAEWTLGREEVKDIPDWNEEEVFFCVGLVACADIPRDREIRWNYGKAYEKRRNYRIGTDCEKPARFQHPIDVIGKIPFHFVTGYIYTPTCSSDSDADPTYKGLLKRLFRFY